MALAGVAEDAQDWAEAERYYLEAIQLGETIRQRQGLQDWSLSASKQVSEPSERLAALLARQGRATEAFQRLDGSRARRLLDVRASLRARQRLTDERRVEVDSLLDVLDGIRLALTDVSSADRSVLDAEATRIQSEIAAATGVRLQAPQTLDVEALQDTLGARQQVLISYLLGAEEAWAFVVRSDTLAAIPLPDATSGDITAAVGRIGRMWRNEGADGLRTHGLAERTHWWSIRSFSSTPCATCTAIW